MLISPPPPLNANQVSVLPFDLIGFFANDLALAHFRAVRIVRLFRLMKLVRVAKASRCEQRATAKF